MAKHSKSAAKPAVNISALEKAAVAAFGGVLNPKARSIMGVVRSTALFALQVLEIPPGAIAIDRDALLLGLLHFGLSDPPGHSTSSWIIQWITEDVGYSRAELANLIDLQNNSFANEALVEKGAPAVLSNDMEMLVKSALALAEATVRRSMIDLRHLVFPMIMAPGEEWESLPRQPTPAEFLRLRQRIVDEIARGHEPGENVAAWSALLQEASESPKASHPIRQTQTVTASSGPDGALFIDATELDRMRDTFLARFPDFEGFYGRSGGYWRVERGYKQTLIDAASNALASANYPEGHPTTIGAALLGILTSNASNLLDWRELRRLDEVRQKAPGLIEQALGDMAQSKLSQAESVARCVDRIAEAYLEGREGNRPFAHLRTLPTTALALARPTEAIAVRYTTMHQAAVRLTGGSIFRNAPMSAEEYQRVLDIAHNIERVMRDDWGWKPRDLWDVQGFLWVATEIGKDPLSKDQSSRKATAEPAKHDGYRTQADDPAMVDALERGPFAAVLATRIVEIRKSARSDEPDGDRAFMVHLHGPWGSGKSSILNLLRRELEEPEEGEASLVVMFNAWRQQRMRPPWWALMNAIYRGAVSRPGRWRERFRLWRTWWFWRWKAEMLPLLLVVVIVAGLTFLILSAKTLGSIETVAKIGVTAAAALASLYAYSRIMIFGSQKAVQAYADLTTDPYRRIIELFNRLVSRIDSPLVVFVDDLDRCDSSYVVELLEGIQTLFRHAPVTYVVAADRKWICSSFEKKYGDFSATIGEPCRPLGYLFLDKLFQISAEMPRLTREVQAAYLAALLREEGSGEAAIAPEIMAEAEERVSGITDEAELQRLIAAEEAKPVPANEKEESHNLQRALRRAAALQITSAAASEETEHRLQKLAHLLEPNPRSMKRLVNAVGMAQARGILEGRTASPETRARWAMLSLRWPVLADFIADHPTAVAHWKKPKGKARRAAAGADWPAAVRALQDDRTVMEVVGGEGEEGALTPDTLAPLLG
jgi:hypothetical protein